MRKNDRYRRRYIHYLHPESGAVLCNPRDGEAAHRASQGDILTTDVPARLTCPQCRQLYYRTQQRQP